MKFTYLWINLAAVVLPFVFTFHPRIRFDRMAAFFWPANLAVAAVFIAWDAWFASCGVWGFNEEFLTGARLLGLPLEEVLFFICIPYACLFTYHCVSLTKIRLPGVTAQRIMTLALATALCVAAVLPAGGLYTRVTFPLLALTLVALQFVFRAGWLGRFYLVYLLLLVPFFLVNGLLTGFWFDAPVVWYDDAENLGMRLLTIPAEDVFYGMLLICWNVAFMEFFRSRKERARMAAALPS
jgi:lycopene cyclase domain-containing protein